MDSFSYRKLFFFILILSAFAGLGSFWDKINSLVRAIGEKASDNYQNSTMGEQLNDISEIFSAATRENCEFECPPGLKPMQSETYKPSSNGCGSRDFSINKKYLPKEIMSKCCDDHDICYCDCEIGKMECDLRFRDCLLRSCNEDENSGNRTSTNLCKLTAEALFVGVSTFGCKSYVETKQQACFCGNNSESD